MGTKAPISRPSCRILGVKSNCAVLSSETGDSELPYFSCFENFSPSAQILLLTIVTVTALVISVAGQGTSPGLQLVTRAAEAQFFQPGCPVQYNRPLASGSN